MDIEHKRKIIKEISVITNKLNNLENLLLNLPDEDKNKIVENKQINRAGTSSDIYKPNISNLKWIKSLRTCYF